MRASPVLLGLMVLLLATTSASAAIHTFSTAKPGDVDPLNNDQLSVDVVVSGTTASFTFSNAGPVGSTITSIYLSDGNYLHSFAGITNSSGVVSYTIDGNGNDNLSQIPGWEGLPVTGGFISEDDLSADPTSPHFAENGIDPGETLTISYNLLSGITQGILDAGLDGQGAHPFHIVMHVQRLGDDQEDSLWFDLETPPPPPPQGEDQLPEPATLAMWGLGAAAFGLLKLRRKKA